MRNYQTGFHRFIVCAVLFLVTGAATAKTDSIQVKEISVYAKGAFNYLDYKLSQKGERNSRYGAGIGIQYARYLDQNWSVSAGLEYQYYRSETLLPDFSDAYATSDAEGDNFEFRSSAGSYREWQWISMLNIPLKIQYETKGVQNRLYASAGIQLGIPVKSKYKATAYGLKTTGYYPQWDALLRDPRFMGFGTWGTVQSRKQKLDSRSSCSLLLELGYKQLLKAKRNLYVGVYADLGLNTLNKKSGNPSALIAYNAAKPTEFQMNSVLNSAPQANGTLYADKLKTTGFGVKLRYAFSL